MEVDYKFQAEYAKSNRSLCRACKAIIAMNSLRLATLVQSTHFDGKIPYWFHSRCFFKKSKVISTSDIKYFDGLKFEDQEKIRQQITTELFDLGFYGLKSVKDAPDKCTHCSKPLQDPYFVDGKKRELGTSLHVKCFVRKNPGVNLANISGISKLKVDEKRDLFAAADNLKPSRKRTANIPDSENIVPKRGKVNEDHANNLKEDLREQSQCLWKLKTELETEVTKDALIGMLEYNEQYVPVGISLLLEAVADGMMFGALTPCPECKEGQLTYANGQYRCMGMANEWARCLFATTNVKRRTFRIPDSYHDVDILRTYKYKPRNRLFAEDVNTTKFSRKAPLAGHHFLIGKGPFQDNRQARDIAASIKQLGGSIITSVSRHGIYVSSALELQSDAPATLKFVQTAKDAHMRSMESKALAFFAKSRTAEEVEQLINKYSISDWPKMGRIPKCAKAESHNKAATSMIKSREEESSMQKMRVKGGAVVDPDSGLEDRASVVRDKAGRPMSAVLGLVDLARGTNSYYRLQLLRSDSNPQKHWVFRAWGRIGTDIGGTKIEKFPSSHGAIRNFEEFYLKQTGNDWGTSKEDFVRVPFRFYPMEMDYGEAAINKKIPIDHMPSKLHVRLQALITFLFDEASMTNTLLEFEIDIRKMPLGQLSKTQIQEAYGVLGNLSRLIQINAKSKTALEGAALSQIVGASTQFYTLIPHDFGMKAPPLLDSLKTIKTKSRMLEDLLEMEVACSLMKVDDESQESVLDSHYANLRNRIQPLEHSSSEFLRIVEYIKKTHGATHSSYSLEVIDIFDVEREGEAAKYDKWRQTENKMMLWHGSRRTNWAGILAKGLRIAPPEAPSTGFMFGKGIYFADMASKSANYCYSSRAATQGCMLLCEVTLGNVHACLRADDSKLTNEFQSRKGVGATYPNPESYYTDVDGVIYPIGEPVSGQQAGHLLYNEFIVYKTSQVKQKYLVWVDFKFN